MNHFRVILTLSVAIQLSLFHNTATFAQSPDHYLPESLSYNSHPDTSFQILSRWARGTCRTVTTWNGKAVIGSGLMLRLLDISNGDTTRLISELQLGNTIVEIKVRNDIVVAITSSRLYVIEIVNADSLKTVGQIAIGGVCNRLALADSLAFILTFSGGLRIVDLTDLSNPFLRNSVGAGGNQSTTMTARGRYVYVGNPLLDYISIYDCRNPDTVTLMTYPIGASADYAKVFDTLLVVAARTTTGLRSLRLFSVLRPGEPTLVSTTELATDVFSIDQTNNQLFVATRDSGLVSFQRGTGGQLTRVSRIERDVRPGFGGRDVATIDSLVLVAFESGLWIARLRNGISTNASFTFTGTSPGRIQTDSGHVFVSQLSCGMLVLSTELDFTGAIEFEGGSFDLAISGTRAYCLNSKGIVAIDISVKGKPTVLGSREILGDKLSIAAYGNNVFVACYDSGLVVLDVSDPRQPEIVGRYRTRGGMLKVVARDTVAFVALIDSGLVVLSISDPSSPRRVAKVLTSATGVGLKNQLAYVATDTGLTILNVTSPSNPLYLGSTRTSGSRTAVEIGLSERNAYLAYGGLYAVDVAAPCCPREFLVISSSSFAPRSVAVQRDTIFVSDFFSVYSLVLDYTSAVNESPLGADQFLLFQNYPNPFNSATTISLRLEKEMRIRLEIIDLLGRHVSTLLDQELAAGDHTIMFEGKGLSSGVYFYILRSGGNRFVKSLTLIR